MGLPTGAGGGREDYQAAPHSLPQTLGMRKLKLAVHPPQHILHNYRTQTSRPHTANIPLQITSNSTPQRSDSA